jgi:DNA phosphorothioation-associated putative methyltransferase
MTKFGKQIGQRLYIHAEWTRELDQSLSDLVSRATGLLGARRDATFNVLRIDPRLEEVAFLQYPQLGFEPFPALTGSWRVHVPSALVTHRRYEESLNPPILHRTELILPPDHPARSSCEMLTKACEAIGLFDNPTIIGFKRTWYELIQQKGYTLSQFDLVPIANATPNTNDSCADVDGITVIERHRTALSRSTLSAPIQSLIRDNLLRKDLALFDYGCGKGDDLATLQAQGFNATGWDPHFYPGREHTPADVVNLGFVINVIEDKGEGITALERAYGLARHVLSVSAMLMSNEPTYGRAFSDGVVTSRHTFQKYYSQFELQHFIEDVLEEDAYPAAPGIFYVFQDRSVEQSYLLSKSSNRSRVARARLTIIPHVRAIRPVRTERLGKYEAPEAQLLIRRLWDTCLELGRTPEQEEVADLDQVCQLFGSLKRALNACLAANDMEALKKASEGRCDDILVMLALRAFERRRKFEIVDGRLKRDLRVFFGSMRNAEAKAHALLFSVKDKQLIGRACEEAASRGLGWLESAKFLQLHTALAERLPAPLRIYIGCATAMAGDLKTFDLVKIHIESGKVSLLSFDDFARKPLPALKTRIKVRLRDQDLDVFSYGGTHTPTVLFHKSRYINEEFPFYAEQIEFEESLARLNAFDLSTYGPTEESLHERLDSLRWRIDGFRLLRSTSIPPLTDRCGTNYTFSQLVNCGETWERSRIDNTPRSPATYDALVDLATNILDPVIEYFGAIMLSYGFASPALTKRIRGRIEPKIDQHSSCELTRSGAAICARLGAAVDFVVEHEDMREVAKWIAAHCPFDRIYLYGPDKPLHVSFGPDCSRKSYELVEHHGRRVPRAISL